MKRIITLLLIFAFAATNAQIKIGKLTKTYQDPARNNRNVTCEVYYPATSDGNNTPWYSGQFPIIVFGHGFVMGVDAYAYFKNAMVPLGYIVVFATTESSMSPSHADFGADLAFLLNKIKTEAATNPSSEFFNKLTTKSAIMGHSMGGGSSFLACKNNIVPTCMVTYAAAKTNPSSITAAFNVTIPAMVMAGELDCVAKPAEHQIPMYDSLASACKFYVSIKNGGHCYFGDYNFNCTFGESTCQPTLPITRQEQQQTTLDFTKLYLDFYLKGNASSWTKFNDSLNSSPRITFRKSCPTTEITETQPSNEINISYLSYENLIYVQTPNDMNRLLKAEIYNINGQLVAEEVLGTSEKFINVSNLRQGYYLCRVIAESGVTTKAFVK